MISYWWLVPTFLAGAVFGIVLVALAINERDDK